MGVVIGCLLTGAVPLAFLSLLCGGDWRGRLKALPKGVILVGATCFVTLFFLGWPGRVRRFKGHTAAEEKTPPADRRGVVRPRRLSSAEKPGKPDVRLKPTGEE
jgi:hypothetical protein